MASQQISRDAFEAFHSGQYTLCINQLDQIVKVKQDAPGTAAGDVKVQHNNLISEYYKNGCLDPQALLEKLSQIYKEAREKEKLKDRKPKKVQEDDEEPAPREDDDFSVLRYNQALLCLQLRLYAQATQILEELFESIEPIDDFLAIKICFALIEVSLLLHQPEKAAQVLNFVEKPNTFLTVLRSERGAKGQGDHPEGEDPGPAAAELENESVAGGETEASEAGEEVVKFELTNSGATEAPEPPDGPLPSLMVGAYLPRHGRAPTHISKAEFAFLCKLYRARLCMALKDLEGSRHCTREAEEVLKEGLVPTPVLSAHQHTTGVSGARDETQRGPEEHLRESLLAHQLAAINVQKACHAYTRKDIKEAMSLLTKCRFNFAHSSSPLPPLGEDERLPLPELQARVVGNFHPAQDESCSAFFYNNLGCLHFMVQKPNLAAFYFQKALKVRVASVPTSAVPGRVTQQAAQDSQNSNLLGAKAKLMLPGVAATRHWLDKRAEISYNAGVQLLLSDRPSKAFKCFEQCIPVLKAWPRLWIRLAECCLEMYRHALQPPGLGTTIAESNGSSGRLMGRATSRVSLDANGAASAGLATGASNRLLAWNVQGSGPYRRWLLTTVRSPPVGRPAPGEEDKADQRTSPAGAPAPPGPTNTAKVPTYEERLPSSPEDALMHATMYLRNVLVLTQSDRLLAVAAPSETPAEEFLVAGAAASSAAPASAAPDKAAQGGKTNSKGSSPTQSSKAGGGNASATPTANRAQAKEFADLELSLLEDAAVVKLAYVCLCQYDFAGALRYSRKLLEKNSLLLSPQESEKCWHFQVHNLATASDGGKFPSSFGAIASMVLYTVEALLHLGRVVDAQSLLTSFQQGEAFFKKAQELQLETQSEVERCRQAAFLVAPQRRPGEVPPVPPEDKSKSWQGGLDPTTSLGGLTPTNYLLKCSRLANQQAAERAGESGKADEESKTAALVASSACEFPRLGDMQCMVLTNLASLHIQDRKWPEAEKCCERALQVQPRALAPLRTLVFLLLRKGQPQEALNRLKGRRMLGPVEEGGKPAHR